MLIISERNGNAFTDDLYNAIYAGILKDRSEVSRNLSKHHDNLITGRLESPQKEQFTALFVDLKITNVVFFIHSRTQKYCGVTCNNNGSCIVRF